MPRKASVKQPSSEPSRRPRSTSSHRPFQLLVASLSTSSRRSTGSCTPALSMARNMAPGEESVYCSEEPDSVTAVAPAKSILTRGRLIADAKARATLVLPTPGGPARRSAGGRTLALRARANATSRATPSNSAFTWSPPTCASSRTARDTSRSGSGSEQRFHGSRAARRRTRQDAAVSAATSWSTRRWARRRWDPASDEEICSLSDETRSTARAAERWRSPPIEPPLRARPSSECASSTGGDGCRSFRDRWRGASSRARAWRSASAIVSCAPSARGT
jgi:hypothetical protein